MFSLYSTSPTNSTKTTAHWHHYHNDRPTHAPAAHGSRPSRAPNANSSSRPSKRNQRTGAYPAANDSNRAWCCVRALARRADAAIGNKEVGAGSAANTGPWRGYRDSSGTRCRCPSLRSWRAISDRKRRCAPSVLCRVCAWFVGGGRSPGGGWRRWYQAHRAPIWSCYRHVTRELGL